MAVFIAWDETAGTPREEYVGGGVSRIVWDNIHTVTRKARWINSERDKDKQGAREYIRELLREGDTRVNLRVIVAKD